MCVYIYGEMYFPKVFLLILSRNALDIQKKSELRTHNNIYIHKYI